ncbi:hypothetical protein LG943_17755 [Streptomonospora sp. S1-112]|uniref:Uncharacterized protein n=1 Tax=Streptomonospora mangrovi TaxID=2883123 RepID=A0A9X3NPY6_9ACTN|nr:hypothetical protein [Streptomonospora mangrovi]MDA0566146.1 hypothetical protein [Streptomonospora mangrovi]
MGRTTALFSLGGAPGVTITAMAMAAVWPEQAGAALVEADASGGDIGAWYRLPASPGVTDLAAATRRRTAADPPADPLTFCQTLPGGLPVCAGPASADPAQGAVQLLATNSPKLAAGGAAQGGPATVVDLGRLAPRTPTAHLAANADDALLLVSDDLAQLRRVKQSAAALADSIGALRVVVVGGSGPTSEIASVVELPVWSGRIPLDTRSAAFLRGEANLRRPQRRPLFKAALALITTLLGAPAGPPPARPQPIAQRYPAAAEQPPAAGGPGAAGAAPGGQP